MPNLDQFPAGQREQEAIRWLLNVTPESGQGLPHQMSGLLAETFDRRYATLSEVHASQRLNVMPVLFPAGRTYTHAVWFQVGGGTGVTLLKVGVYSVTGPSSGGTLLATTANESAVGGSPGQIDSALTTPLVVGGQRGDPPVVCLAAFLGVASTANPLVATTEIPATMAGVFGSGMMLSGRQDSIADLPATLGVNVAYGLITWLGFY